VRSLRFLGKGLPSRAGSPSKSGGSTTRWTRRCAELRARLAEIRAASEAVPDTHDYSEAETRRWLIDAELRRAGWPLDSPRAREYRVTGMPNAQGEGYADYVLWGDDGKPLAVVEAKRTTWTPPPGVSRRSCTPTALRRCTRSGR